MPPFAALVLLSAAVYLFAQLSWGIGDRQFTPLRLLILWWISGMLTSGLYVAGRRVTAAVWLAIGSIILVAMSLPAPTFLAIFPWRGDVPFAYPEGFSQFFITSTGLVAGAVLISKGVGHFRQRDSGEGEGSPANSNQAVFLSAGALMLGLALVLTALHRVYWLMLWDTTYDSIGFFVLTFPILAALISGALLTAILSGRWRAIGPAYSLMVIFLMAVLYLVAQSRDYRLITEAHANRVHDAIERYHSHNGRYPEKLGQLIPRYALYLPGPLIIFGQDWCYEGGPDYYRLGYVFREHWSDPRLSGSVYQRSQDFPLSEPICGSEIAALQAQYSEYPFVRVLSEE